MSIDTKELDERGFLLNQNAWNRQKARAIAEGLGLTVLTEQHFAIMQRIRDHYQQHRAIPPSSLVCHEADPGDDCIDQMFAGPLSAWKAAGLPDPGEEARIYLDKQTITNDETSP